jgi:hypoxanthine phosphoribosyltransferase
MEKKDFKPGDVLIDAKTITNRLDEISSLIAVDYPSEFVLVSILKGSCTVTADLQRALYKVGCTKFSTSFITLKSYLSGTESSRKPKLVQDVDFDPQNKHILLVDDIIDTGYTLLFLHRHLKERGASVHSFVLLSKPERREVDYEADYVGFTIPNVWVEGYGMDSDEKGRGNPDIIVGPSYG